MNKMFFYILLSYFLPILLTLLTIIYLYFQYAFTYWKRKGVVYLQPSFPYGNVKELLQSKACFGKQVETLYHQLKRKNKYFGGFYASSLPVLMPLDPQLIKSILLNDFCNFSDRGFYINEERDPLSGILFVLNGEKWDKMRMKTTPNFTTNKMKTMFDTMKAFSEGLDPLVEEYIRNGKSIDTWDLVSRYTTDNIVSYTFGVDSNSTKTAVPEFCHFGKICFSTTFSDPILIVCGILFRRLLKFFNVPTIDKSVSSFFMNAFNQTVKYREKMKIHRNDFLDYFLKFKQKEYVDDDGKVKKNDEPLTDDEIAAQAFGVFLGGFETSASTITYCLLELTLNQDIQKKLRKSIKDVLKQNDGELTYETVMEMTYLEQVVDETLRKYPAVPLSVRECVKDYTIPGTDITIEKGVHCWIPFLGIHKDPQYYPDPEKFDPERFTKEEKDKRHICTYLPFSRGLRICIGKKFGLLQVKICLAQLLRKYEFSLDPKTEVPLVIKPTGLLLSLQNPVWLQVNRAEDKNIKDLIN